MLVTRARRSAKRHDAQPPHDGRRPTVGDGIGPAAASCSSTSRGGSASSSQGLQVALFGKVDAYRGGLQMTNPVVDLIGDRTGRIVPIYPQSEKAGLDHVGDRRLGRGRAASAAGRGASPTRCPPTVARRARPRSTGSAALLGIHLPESMAEKEQARRRLAFDELLRVQLVLVLRKRALERDAEGIRHDVDGELVRALPRRGCRSRSPAPSGGRSPRSSATWPARTRCTGCCRATSAPARRWSP